MGKTVDKNIKKQTKNCNKTDFNLFMKYVMQH